MSIIDQSNPVVKPVELVSVHLVHFAEGDEIHAVWRDAIGTFTALHGLDGRVTTAPTGIAVPPLPQEAIEEALAEPEEEPAPQPHPAYALAEAGTAARPELASRMQAAADLVAAGAVELIDEAGAMVNGYAVGSETCTCRDFYFRRGWCKHRLAVRMARRLGQEHTGRQAPRKLGRQLAGWQVASEVAYRAERYATSALFRERCQMFMAWSDPNAQARIRAKALAEAQPY